jgi:hypothetical protein
MVGVVYVVSVPSGSSTSQVTVVGLAATPTSLANEQ